MLLLLLLLLLENAAQESLIGLGLKLRLLQYLVVSQRDLHFEVVFLVSEEFQVSLLLSASELELLFTLVYPRQLCF